MSSNLFTEKQMVKSNIFGSIALPVLDQGYTYVFSDGNAGFFNNESGLTKSLMRSRNYKFVYMVNVSPQRIVVKVTCQCRNPIYHYDVELKTKSKVSDPAKIVKDNVQNLKEVLEMQIQKWANDIVRKYDEIQHSDVEHTLNSNIESLKFDLEDEGIELQSTSIVLSMDKRVSDRAIKKDITDYDLTDKLRSEEMKKIIGMAKMGNTSEFISKAKELFGDSPETLMWMDQVLGENTAQSVMGATRDKRIADINAGLDVFVKIKDKGLMEDHQIASLTQKAMSTIMESGADVADSSSGDSDAFSADDLLLEDDNDE